MTELTAPITLNPVDPKTKEPSDKITLRAITEQDSFRSTSAAPSAFHVIHNEAEATKNLPAINLKFMRRGDQRKFDDMATAPAEMMLYDYEQIKKAGVTSNPIYVPGGKVDALVNGRLEEFDGRKIAKSLDPAPAPKPKLTFSDATASLGAAKRATLYYVDSATLDPSGMFVPAPIFPSEVVIQQALRHGQEQRVPGK